MAEECEGGEPIAAAVRKQGEMNAGAQLAFSPFQPAWDPQPMG